jgi:DNA-binding transcriptional ArsR family regulator
MTPSVLSALLDIPASTLSFHLKELMHAGLVSVERESRNLHYRPALAQHERPAVLPHRPLLHGQVLCTRRRQTPHHLLIRSIP